MTVIKTYFIFLSNPLIPQTPKIDYPAHVNELSDNNGKPALSVSSYYKDQTIEKLKTAFTRDYLEVDEFEKRLDLATHAQTKADLEVLIDDLPDLPPEPEANVDINKGPVKEKETMACILGGVQKKGAWKPPRHLKIIAVLGGADLDFTNAEFPPGVTEIRAFCLLGGLQIRVPEGINVDSSCVSILGGLDDKSRGMHNKDAPTLKIRGVNILGGVEIKLPRQNLLEKILKKFNII